MKLTQRHYRAIGVYAKQNGLRLALSVPPQISYRNEKDKLVTLHLDKILHFYDDYRKQAAKERARAKKEKV